jgi:hypothetical protein
MRRHPPCFALFLTLVALFATRESSAAVLPGPMFDAAGYGYMPSPVRAVTLADMDFDGRADLLVETQTGFAMARATGSGSFAPFVYALPGLRSFEVADFDGDGRQDVGGTKGGTPDRAFVGYGDGLGGWAGSFEVDMASYAATHTAADVNGDGRADLLLTRGDEMVTIYFGNANRTLTEGPTYALGGYPERVAVGDVASSAAPDIVVALDEDNLLVVFPGNGDGTFGARIDQTLASYTTFMGLGPFDANSPWDLVFRDNSALYFASGLVSGTFAPADPLPQPDGGRGLVLRDFNHDGKLDVASASDIPGRINLLFWPGDGAGGFGPRVSSGGLMSPGVDLTAGDVDGDGHLDVAYASSSNMFSAIVTRGHGDGTFGGPAPPAPVPGRIAGGAAGDFDGDGKLDAVGCNAVTLKLAFARGRGDCTFDPITESGALALGYVHLAAGRFDADANLDLVGVAVTPPTLSFLRGHGDGTFDAPVDFALGARPKVPVVVDLNADGKLDVVVPCTGANALSVLLQGPAGLVAPVSSPTPIRPQAVAYAHLNGDGLIDRVLACSADVDGGGVGTTYAGQLVSQLDNGAGGYTTVTTASLTPGPGAIELADVDEDGQLDALVNYVEVPVLPQYPPNLRFLRGHADGSFDFQYVIGMNWHLWATNNPPAARRIFARELDGDGHLDLLVGDDRKSGWIGARGVGGGAFNNPESFLSNWTGSFFDLGDFDGDGSLDGLSANGAGTPSVTSFSIVRNRAGGVVDVPAPTPSAVRVSLAISAISPNPSRGALALDLWSETAGAGRVALLSPTGRVVHEGPEVPLGAGANRVRLDAGGGLAPGVYLLRVTRGDAVATRKAIMIPR